MSPFRWGSRSRASLAALALWQTTSAASAEPGRASVALPATAADFFEVRDDRSGLSVRVWLEGGGAQASQGRGDWRVYPGALRDGSEEGPRERAQGTLALRAGAWGVEDFVYFSREPRRREVRYRVALGEGVAGLRLVDGVLEFLDHAGAPRLHVDRPYLLGERGERFDAETAVEGCQHDTSAAAPWGRAVVEPGARSCEVRVRWGAEVSYPAVLDPLWTVAGKIGTIRSQHVAHLLTGARVLVAGGLDKNGIELSSTEIYDRATDTWATSGKLIVPRVLAAISALPGGNLLATGGLKDGTTLNSTELYEVSAGQWTLGPAMAQKRSSHRAVELPDGRLVVVGGDALTAEVLDAGQVAWTETEATTKGRVSASATLLASGKVLVAGGFSASVALATSEILDPGTGKWSASGALKKARGEHAAVTLMDGRVMLIGGRNSTDPLMQVTTEIFDESAGAWSFGANLNDKRHKHTATLLSSGKVLAVGGGGSSVNDVAELASAELYDPATNSWGLLEPMANGMNFHTATRLPSGEVLVVGHYTQGNPGVGAEIFGLVAGSGLCGVAGECASGFCVDGVCCDTACDAPCEACTTAKKGAGVNGVCGPVVAGQDPDGDCPDDGAPSCQRDGACDGSGQCRLYDVKDGCAPSACAAPGECASGFCVDGVCCNTACDDPCLACTAAKKGAGGDGVCGPVVAGQDPDGDCQPDVSFPYSCGADGLCDGAGKCRAFAPDGTVCNDTTQCVGGIEVAPRCNAGHKCDPNIRECAPFACDKGGKLCADSCSDDTRCAPSAYCDVAQGVCVPDRPVGQGCAGDNQCQGGHCVDGVCCDTACDKSCQACTAAKKGAGADGVCEPVAAGQDPDGDCPDDGAPSCQRDGTCDGSGKCRLYPLKTPCSGFPQCSGASALTTAVCDGQGKCSLDPEVVSCGKYACSQGKCLDSCAQEGDCAPGLACVAGVCGARLDPGQSCTAPQQCESGFCVDGVCCDAPCSGQCEACDLSGKLGLCSPVSGNPHGARARCGAEDAECGGQCDGANTQQCAYPGATTLCKNSVCAGSVLVPVVCNGQGACAVTPSQNCAPYGCDVAGCKIACGADSDCAAGAVCDVQARQCVPAGTVCSGAFTLKLADGSQKSCAPYACVGSACKTSCAGNSECSDGYGCSGQVCVKGAAGAAGAAGSSAGGSGGAAGQGGAAPAAPAADEEQGCGCRAVSGGSLSPWPLVALAAAMARRRRRGAGLGRRWA